MTMLPALLLQGDTDLSGGAAAGLFAVLGSMMLVFLAIFVVFVIGGWKVFTKAGQPGWAIIIPIYNIYILLTIVGRPAWWIILFFIPIANIVVGLLVAIDLAKSFGQSTVFGIVLLFLFSFIGWLVLGFGNYKYVGPGAAITV
jgi:hypothetical protein